MMSTLPVRMLLSPVLLPQGVSLRRRATALPEPVGPREGVTGTGPDLRLLIVGGSSAAGVGVGTQDDALTGKLVADLARDFTVFWRLEARAGATTGQTLARLLSVDLGQIDVAVVSVGVNDVQRHVSAMHYRRQQRALSQLLLGHGAKQIWRCAVPPMEHFLVPWPLRGVMAARARRLDEVLIRDSHPPLYRLPFHSTQLHPSQLAPSGVHPGAGLYADWARRLAAEIRARA